MRTPPATTRFFNGLGRRVAYFYVRQLMRSDIEWGTDLPSGAKIIAVNHPTTDSFLVMSWPFEPIYILISEAAFRVPLVFEHDADDREAVKLSTDVLMEEIKRLMERSAKRLLERAGLRQPVCGNLSARLTRRRVQLLI
jgi:hypothetical protein